MYNPSYKHGLAIDHLLKQLTFVLVQVALAHIHNLHFKKMKFLEIAGKLQKDMYLHKARFLMSDGNKKAYSFDEFFKSSVQAGSASSRSSASPFPFPAPYSSQQSLVQADFELALVACHTEFQQQRSDRAAEDTDEEEGACITGREVELSPQKVVLHDSMVIMAVGPHHRIRSEGQARHALHAATWPQEDLEVNLQVGFQAKTYNDGSGVAPEEDLQLLEHFDAAKLIFDRLKETVHIRIDDKESTDVRRLTDMGLAEYKMRMKDIPQKWQPASRASGRGDRDWPQLPHIREMLSDWKRSDPSGKFHGRNAHIPLLVKMCVTKERHAAVEEEGDGSVQAGEEEKAVWDRQRSADGYASRAVRNQKSTIFKETGRDRKSTL